MDDSFPPAPKSLYYNPSESRDAHVVQWRRPQDIDVEGESDSVVPWAVFRTPRPSDISQGKIIGHSSVFFVFYPACTFSSCLMCVIILFISLFYFLT